MKTHFKNKVNLNHNLKVSSPSKDEFLNESKNLKGVVVTEQVNDKIKTRLNNSQEPLQENVQIKKPLYQRLCKIISAKLKNLFGIKKLAVRTVKSASKLLPCTKINNKKSDIKVKQDKSCTEEKNITVVKNIVAVKEIQKVQESSIIVPEFQVDHPSNIRKVYDRKYTKPSIELLLDKYSKLETIPENKALLITDKAQKTLDDYPLPPQPQIVTDVYSDEPLPPPPPEFELSMMSHFHHRQYLQNAMVLKKRNKNDTKFI